MNRALRMALPCQVASVVDCSASGDLLSQQELREAVVTTDHPYFLTLTQILMCDITYCHFYLLIHDHVPGV